MITLRPLMIIDNVIVINSANILPIFIRKSSEVSMLIIPIL